MESRFVRSSDGIRNAYDRSGGGRPLVLLHGGFVHDRRSWHTSGYIDRLRDRFFVLAIDLRGHGESDCPAAPGTGFGLFTEPPGSRLARPSCGTLPGRRSARMSTKKDAEVELAQSLSLRFGVPAINLADIALDRDLIRHVPVDVARRHQVLPIAGDAGSLTVAMADPSDRSGIDTLREKTGLRIQVVVAPRSTLLRTIERFYFAN